MHNLSRASVAAGILVAVQLVAATAWPIGRSAHTRGDEKPRPAPETQDERPNVLIIVTDDQRLEGTMAALPSVAKWFGDEGTEFPNAYATTPLCCPSRASILTGRYPHNHRVQHNGREARRDMNFDRTLPAFFKGAGYRTGLFGKFFNKWPSDVEPPHFDRWTMSGADYYNARFNIQGRLRQIPRYSTHVVSDHASRFMNRSITADKPWFMYVAPVAAHGPFTPERAYRRAPVPRLVRGPGTREKNRSDKPSWVARRRPPRRRDMRAVYRGQLRTLMSVDDMVQRLFSELEARGEADNTIAVFTSDHGYMWGEHGLGRKEQPYLESIKVPFFLRWPRQVAAGVRDPRLAANIDIAPTVLDAAAIDMREPFDGMSLLQPLTRESLFLEYAATGKREDDLPSWGSIVNRDRQYTVYFDPDHRVRFREYYDLQRDPAQLRNLLGDRNRNNDPPTAWRKALDAQIERGRSCSGTSCWFTG